MYVPICIHQFAGHIYSSVGALEGKSPRGDCGELGSVRTVLSGGLDPEALVPSKARLFAQVLIKLQ